MDKKATGNVLARKAFFRGIAQIVHQPAAAKGFGLSCYVLWLSCSCH